MLSTFEACGEAVECADKAVSAAREKAAALDLYLEVRRRTASGFSTIFRSRVQLISHQP